MKEGGLEKPKKVKRLEDLRALIADATPDSDEPKRAHSLSSAATEESGISNKNERPEWADIIKRPEDGSENGRKFWHVGDGSIYIDSGTPVPIKVVHGGPFDFRLGTKNFKTLYWNNNKNAFGEEDPTPEVRTERDRIAKAREDADAAALSAKERKSKSAKPQAPTPIDAEHDARTVKTPGVMSAEEIGRMQQVVASMNAGSEAVANAKAEKESIDKLRGQLKSRIQNLDPQKHWEKKESLFKQANALKGAGAREELDALGRRLDELESGKAANPEAALTGIGKGDAKRVFVESGDTLFVKDGRAVRQATAEEVVEHAAKKKAEIEARAAQFGAHASPERPTDASESHAPERLSRLEDMYEMQGKTPEDFLAGLEATAKKRMTGSGVPRMRQTEEVREVEERIPLSELLGTHRPEFEGIKAMTQREILTDAEGEVLFPELLLKLDPESAHLIQKSVAGESLTEYESKLLHYARYEYTRRMNQVSALRKWMKPADLEIVARKNEDFDQVMGLNGADRTTEFLKAHIARMGMDNPEALNRLYSVYSRLSTLRDSREYRKWADDIYDLCEETGVNPDDFGIVFDTSSPEKIKASRSALASKYHNELDTGLRILDSVLPFTKMKAAWKVGKAKWLASRMNEGAGGAPEEVGMQLRNLAKMLKYTVTDEQEVVRMLEREAFQNKNIPHPSERSDHSFDAAEKKGTATEKAVDERLQAHIKNFKDDKGRDWAHTTRVKREESLRPLRNSLFESQAAEAGTSWFSRALNGLFEMLFDSKFKQAITMPHAI